MSKVKRRAETWPAIDEIIFAVNSHHFATEFARAFDGQVEAGPSESIEDEEDEPVEHQVAAKELQEKISEMENQLSKVWNADLKARMMAILDGLKAQRNAQERTDESHSHKSHVTGSCDDASGDDEGDVMITEECSE